MPYYYFDLMIEGQPHAQGGMILEDFAVASDWADALASELSSTDLNYIRSGALSASWTRTVPRSTAHP